MPPKGTRSSGPVLDPDLVFVESQRLTTQLPDIKTVIGLIKFHKRKDNGRKTEGQVLREVAKLIYTKWWHDTVYCITISGIVKKVTKLWKEYREGVKRMNAGRDTSTATQKYKDICRDKDKLFDVFANEKERKDQCELEWGVKMSPAEKAYYEDQKEERKQFCDRAVDPVWYTATMKKQRLKERSEVSRREMQSLMEYKSMEEIDQMLLEDGDIQEEIPVKEDTDDENNYEVDSLVEKRKLTMEDEDDALPLRYRHIRDSERKVKEEVYRTIGDLMGKGMSRNEAVLAVIIVANKLFDRQWKEQEKSEEGTDLRDMMPSLRSILEALNLMETQALAATVERMVEGREEGRMVTHAIDSTTKQGIGQFATQGIHIGRDSALPLPLMNICGESTQDIALQVDHAFHCLAVSKGVPVEEVYKLVSAHMTDSVEHNKGFNKILQELYSLEEPAGQLFCGSHTTLGFSNCMDKFVGKVEEVMKISQVTSKFMVGLDISSKNSSVAGLALDIMLKLVAPEYNHKMWNYYKQFTLYLETHDIEPLMFAYKDQRFGCLSRAAAVLIFLYEPLGNFLSDNPQIVNKLACLARELLQLPYLKTIFLVFASLGIHIIEPFFAKTIQTTSTHSSLKNFYQELYDGMNTKVDGTFFNFTQPQFSAVSQNMFDGVKKSYGSIVVESLTNLSAEYGEDAAKLVNMLLPEMRKVLGRQRRDYGLDQAAFPVEFLVEKQAENVDDCPVTNLEMERFCGKVDYREKKLKTLAAVSRSMILDKQQQKEGETSSFRSFKAETIARRELDLEWSEKMKQKFKENADMKQITSMQKERKRLDQLEKLKHLGGPFTDASDVDKYLKDSEISPKNKKDRMKMELQFARDSSTTLPKVDPLFRVMVTMPNKKKRDKTAEEFGEALMAFLGRREDQISMDYSVFRTSLDKLME